VKKSGDNGGKDQEISTEEWKRDGAEENPVSFHTGIPNPWTLG
jgi:hypothetical protein